MAPQESPVSFKRQSSMSEKGRITCILGPMFSGKTTELLRLHERQTIARRNCVLVKYAGDTRYDADLVATHSKQTGQGTTVKAHHLSEVRHHIFDDAVQVVSIDEGQFFDDMAEMVEELARRGKSVYVAALNGTFERKPFPQVSLMLPYVDDIRQMHSVCVECGGDGTCSFRSSTDLKVEVIGGEDLYKALCRDCYHIQTAIRDSNAEMDELSENNNNCSKDKSAVKEEAHEINDITNCKRITLNA